MKKKINSKKIKKKSVKVGLHIYGLFDMDKKEMTKISLEQSEIQMELALLGGLSENLLECEFDIHLLF